MSSEASCPATPAHRAKVPAAKTGRTLRLVGLAIPMRLLVDATMRLFYPYLPEISRGLGISLAEGGFLLSARSAMILASPLSGTWNDRHGPRGLLSLVLVVQGLGLWWVSTAQGLLAALPAMLVLGLTASAFIPILQATISDQVPFRRRGRVLAMVEFSWALSGLVVVPLVGWLMVQRGWQTPLRLIGLLSLVLAPLPLLLPQRARPSAVVGAGLRRLSALVWQSHSARGVIALNALLYVAAETFFATYGAWLEQSFGLAPDQIGRIAGLMSLAELMGSGLSSLIIDRVGKRRGVGAGLLAMTLTALAVPWLGSSVALATIGLMAFILSFEFTIVSHVGLMSEQVPQARGTVLSLAVMAGGVTRTLTGYGGIRLWQWQGMQGVAMLAALGSFVAFLVLARWVRERAEEGERVVVTW